MAVLQSVMGVDASNLLSNLTAPIIPAASSVCQDCKSPAHSHRVATEYFCFYSWDKKILSTWLE